MLIPCFLGSIKPLEVKDAVLGRIPFELGNNSFANDSLIQLAGLFPRTDPLLRQPKDWLCS